MSKSGIEIRIVGLKQEEWDRVQRVGYKVEKSMVITTIFAYFLNNMLISVYFNL